MSSRAVRRALQEQEMAQMAARQAEAESSESEERRQNPFDLLMGNISSDEDVETAQPCDRSPSQVIERESSSGQKSKKKKKKKKKKKAKTSSPVDDEDEVEAAIREVEAELGQKLQLRDANDISNADAGQDYAKGLLDIDMRMLDAEAELRRKFGMTHGPQRRGPRPTGRGRTVRSAMVKPKENWPRMQRTGLTMVQSDTPTPDGEPCFRLQHSPTYQDVQLRFLRAVRTMDPNAISAVLRHHPYHIDSLIQMSEVCKMSGDLQTAGDLVERALYCLQASFHPSFKPQTAHCRLQYAVYENRCLFIALYRHISFLANRACWRTGLECNKFMLSLSPDDPLGALLWMDLFALRAGEFAYLRQMSAEWQQSRHWDKLPNFAFSTALASYLQSQETDNQDQRQLLATEAEDQLQLALMRFPEMLTMMAEKCRANIRPDILACPHFQPSLAPNHSERNVRLMLILYVERCHELWKPEHVMTWLHQGAEMLMLQLITGPIPEVEVYTQERKTDYPQLPQSIQRHVVLADIGAAMALLPPDVSAQGVLAYDPLPPSDGPGNPYQERLEPSIDTQYSGGALGAFLQSLLPGFNAEAEAARAQQQGRALPAAFEAGNLHTRLADVVSGLGNLIGRQAGDEGELADEEEMAAANLYLDENGEDGDDQDFATMVQDAVGRAHLDQAERRQ